MEILRRDYKKEKEINGKTYRARPLVLDDEFFVLDLIEREEKVAQTKLSPSVRRRKENIYYAIRSVEIQKKREDGSIYWDSLNYEYFAQEVTWAEIQQIFKLMNEVNSLAEVKKKSTE